MRPLIDIHTHRLEFAPENISVFNLLLGGPEPLPELGAKRLFSAGLHPWYLKRETLSGELEKLMPLARDTRCMAIGECGLDKLRGAPFELQIEAFEAQARLSVQVGKPLLIHCVRAQTELLALKKKLRTDQEWIVHGFQGSAETAREFLNGGISLSVGAAILKKDSKLRRTLPEIPRGKLFFETDEAEELRKIYEEAANLLSLSINEMTDIIYDNFVRIFGEKHVQL